jgi:hypothetical protein
MVEARSGDLRQRESEIRNLHGEGQVTKTLELTEVGLKWGQDERVRTAARPTWL